MLYVETILMIRLSHTLLFMWGFCRCVGNHRDNPNGGIEKPATEFINWRKRTKQHMQQQRHRHTDTHKLIAQYQHS